MFKWDKDSCTALALQCASRGEFQKKSAGAYNHAVKNGFLVEICSHMKRPPHKWTKEECLCLSLPCHSRGEFKKRHINPYQYALKHGFLDEICSHMKELCHRWTKEECRAEALRFTTRTEFARQCWRAYQHSFSYGLLDEICSHMKELCHRWTKEECQSQALQCSSRSEFCVSFNGAYNHCHKNGFLDEICSHMKPSRGVSIPERQLFNLIKEVFPSVRKRRTLSVCIEGKPYITGFEIDMFIPELNKGIEFDGNYWHSVEGLSRSRPGWPIDDIENYHQIKDNYFQSLGIQLLHVSEQDWEADQEKCLKTIALFLA